MALTVFLHWELNHFAMDSAEKFLRLIDFRKTCNNKKNDQIDGRDIQTFNFYFGALDLHFMNYIFNTDKINLCFQNEADKNFEQQHNQLVIKFY